MALVVKNPPAYAGDIRGASSIVAKFLRRRAWQPTLEFLPEESHDQKGAQRATVRGVAELDTAE